MTDLVFAQKNSAVIDYLAHRRSVSVKTMTSPGPDAAARDAILAIAARVPDHGKLNPWWFICFEGQKRAEFGSVLAEAWAKRDATATPEKLADEANRLLRAPLIIAVIARPRPSTIPVWEQLLSAGAVCQNMCIAANAMGFATNWLTEWYAYDPHVRTALNLDARDHIAGFIYIGTPTTAPEERARPDLAQIVNHDFAKAHARGDASDKPEMPFDHKGLRVDSF